MRSNINNILKLSTLGCALIMINFHCQAMENKYNKNIMISSCDNNLQILAKDHLQLANQNLVRFISK